MRKTIPLLLLSLTLPLAAETMNIQTLNGQVFEDAQIERVNPNGIDIGYVNEKGHYVLKGILFKDLSEELQKKFGYDPEKSRKFESEVRKYEKTDINKVADEEKTRLERITEQIKAKFAGEKITLKPADLRYAIHAWRRSVELTPVKDTKTGCVVKIDKVVSGKPIESELVLLDGIHLPAEGSWSGFLYPAGVQAIYDRKQIPVFTGSLDDSTEILTQYLEIYAEYAAAEDDKKNLPDANAQAPDQAKEQPQTVKETHNAPPDQWTDDGKITYSPYGSYYGFVGDGVYFIAGNFIPVAWWNHCYPDRPPRPRPPHPRPPRPPHPRPPRPPHDKPGKPGKPDKPGVIIKPGKPDKPGVIIKPGKPDKPGVIIKPGKPGKPDIITRPGRPEKPNKPTAEKPSIQVQPGNRNENSNRVIQRPGTIQRQNTVRGYEIRRTGNFRQAVPARRVR